MNIVISTTCFGVCVYVCVFVWLSSITTRFVCVFSMHRASNNTLPIPRTTPNKRELVHFRRVCEVRSFVSKNNSHCQNQKKIKKLSPHLCTMFACMIEYYICASSRTLLEVAEWHNNMMTTICRGLPPTLFDSVSAIVLRQGAPACPYYLCIHSVISSAWLYRAALFVRNVKSYVRWKRRRTDARRWNLAM